MSLIGVPSSHLVFECKDVANVGTGTAAECIRSFKTFRATIRPNMKWNWMVERVCDEMQVFDEAFERGLRPKLAIELPAVRDLRTFMAIVPHSPRERYKTAEQALVELKAAGIPKDVLDFLRPVD